MAGVSGQMKRTFQLLLCLRQEMLCPLLQEPAHDYTQQLLLQLLAKGPLPGHHLLLGTEAELEEHLPAQHVYLPLAVTAVAQCRLDQILLCTGQQQAALDYLQVRQALTDQPQLCARLGALFPSAESCWLPALDLDQHWHPEALAASLLICCSAAELHQDSQSRMPRRRLSWGRSAAPCKHFPGLSAGTSGHPCHRVAKLASLWPAQQKALVWHTVLMQLGELATQKTGSTGRHLLL